MTKYLCHSSSSNPVIISLYSYSLRIFIAEKLQAQINIKKVHTLLNRGGAWWYVNTKST